MKALIVVDLQNDFMPGGTLPVARGDEVAPLANRLMKAFPVVVTTQDWHPRKHGSFAASHRRRHVGDVIDLNGLEQILWPVHCVQNTKGAAFVDELDVDGLSYAFQKGTDPGIDSYSGFFDNGYRRATSLDTYLTQRLVQRVYVCGVATDYCVKYTCLDARLREFETFLIEDACRGVNLKRGDVRNAVREMQNAGVKVVKSRDILKA